MSTKIFNTWLLPVGADPFDIVPELRPLMVAQRMRAEATSLVADAIHLLDRDALGKAPDDFRADMPISSAERKRRATAPAHSVDADPNYFDSIFLRDPKTQRLLFMGFFRDRGYLVPLDEFAQRHGWQSFEYWNNSDRPDDMSEEAWDARRET